MLLRVLLICIVCALPPGLRQISEPRRATKPSIILIMTDDMETGLVEHMPSVKELLVEQGSDLRASLRQRSPTAALPVATILTGKYAQNTGVTLNSHKQFDQAATRIGRSPSGSRRPAIDCTVGKYLTAIPAQYLRPTSY